MTERSSSRRRCTPEDEDELERSLRPRALDDFVGQERVKEQLAIALDGGEGRAARRSTTSCSSARPGSARRASRTSSARSSASASARSPGPALERKGDMAAILTSLEERDVLFVDEIHRLNRAVEEILYPALEDFRLDIVVGQGPAARTLTLDLPPFTLVGATTRTGLLTTPLRDRFGMTFRLDYYEPDELASIVRRSARILGVEIDGRRRRRDRAPRARDAAHRQPDPPPRPRRRRGAARRARSRPTSRARRSSCSRSTSTGSSAPTASCCARSSSKFGGGPGRPLDARRRARRGAGHDRGRLRAVPAPARLHPAHAARPHRRPELGRAHLGAVPDGLRALLGTAVESHLAAHRVERDDPALAGGSRMGEEEEEDSRRASSRRGAVQRPDAPARSGDRTTQARRRGAARHRRIG